MGGGVGDGLIEDGTREYQRGRGRGGVVLIHPGARAKGVVAVTAHFTDQPQVPFESFNFIYTDPGNGRATLTSPVGCGDYSVTADMTPYRRAARSPRRATASPSPAARRRRSRRRSACRSRTRRPAAPRR